MYASVGYATWLDTCADRTYSLHMASVHQDWRERADRLRVRMPLLAKATNANVFTVRAYRQGRFQPSPEWLERVDRFLTSIEQGKGGEAA